MIANINDSAISFINASLYLELFGEAVIDDNMEYLIDF